MVSKANAGLLLVLLILSGDVSGKATQIGVMNSIHAKLAPIVAHSETQEQEAVVAMLQEESDYDPPELEETEAEAAEAAEAPKAKTATPVKEDSFRSSKKVPASSDSSMKPSDPVEVSSHTSIPDHSSKDVASSASSRYGGSSRPLIYSDHALNRITSSAPLFGGIGYMLMKPLVDFMRTKAGQSVFDTYSSANEASGQSLTASPNLDSSLSSPLPMLAKLVFQEASSNNPSTEGQELAIKSQLAFIDAVMFILAFAAFRRSDTKKSLQKPKEVHAMMKQLQAANDAMTKAEARARTAEEALGAKKGGQLEESEEGSDVDEAAADEGSADEGHENESSDVDEAAADEGHEDAEGSEED